MSIEPEFGGATYDPMKDAQRLRDQLGKVRSAMLGAGWCRLKWLSEQTKAPEASVSARIRDLRKPKYGGYTIDRRRVPGRESLYEYRIVQNGGGPDPCPALAHGKTRSENAGAP